MAEPGQLARRGSKITGERPSPVMPDRFTVESIKRINEVVSSSASFVDFKTKMEELVASFDRHPGD